MSLKRTRQIKRKADADKIKAQKVWRVADWPLLSIAIFPAYAIEGIEVTPHVPNFDIVVCGRFNVEVFVANTLL